MRSSLSALAAVMVITTLTSVVAAQDLEVTRADSVDESEGTEPTWLFVGIGAAMLVGEYFGELAITAATGGSAEDLELAAIPFAGPWLELEQGESEWWEIGLTVYEGVMQLAALTLVVVGLAWQRPTGPRTSDTIVIAPVPLAGGGGIGVSGAW